MNGWTETRLRYVADLNPSVRPDLLFAKETELSFLPMEAIGESGSLDLSRTRPVSEVRNGYSYFADGDIAFAKVTPCFENGKGALMQGLTGGAGFGTTEITVLRPRTGTNARFLNYVLKGDDFRKMGFGAMTGAGGLKRVPDDFTRDFHTPWPESSQQERIANFLDDKTARIDALIAEKELLVDKLREYWRSVSVDIALGRTDASSEMVETGIPWLGRVPKHWQVRPVKTLFRLVAEQSNDDHGLELLSLYTEIGVRPRKDLEQKGNRASNTDGYWLVKENDLVVNKLLAWMGAIAGSAYSGVTSPAYDILRPTTDLNTWYYDAIFRSGIYLTEFKSKSRGIMDMRLRLYFEELGTVKVPYPPRNEQDNIVRMLGLKKSHIDSLIDHSIEHVARLREYRSSLISAAVTGQLDVSAFKEAA